MPDIQINVSKELGRAAVIGHTERGANWVTLNMPDVYGTPGRPIVYIDETGVLNFCEALLAVNLDVKVSYT